ncbi:MAG: thioredoxin family protein [Candidatus Gastranaerophilales bacterium]|nr:thioredoxin family protein [Candidatus Gastranaerophilales bacterium]
MKKHMNLAIIVAIFIIPIMLYYSFKSTDQDTASIATGLRPTVIDFSSEMCMECRELKKVMDQVEPKYDKKIIFKKIMINSASSEDQKLVKKYEVKVVPTLVYLDKNGKVIKKTEGALPKEELERNFNRLINGKSS